jgi:hypothetical protein
LAGSQLSTEDAKQLVVLLPRLMLQNDAHKALRDRLARVIIADMGVDFEKYSCTRDFKHLPLAVVELILRSSALVVCSENATWAAFVRWFTFWKKNKTQPAQLLAVQVVCKALRFPCMSSAYLLDVVAKDSICRNPLLNGVVLAEVVLAQAAKQDTKRWKRLAAQKDASFRFESRATGDYRMVELELSGIGALAVGKGSEQVHRRIHGYKIIFRIDHDPPKDGGAETASIVIGCAQNIDDPKKKYVGGRQLTIATNGLNILNAQNGLPLFSDNLLPRVAYHQLLGDFGGDLYSMDWTEFNKKFVSREGKVRFRVELKTI